jgi:8-hydroxy-5-deazaflavin:NADPH oxidoreductase
MVGHGLADRVAELGHEVRMGARDPGREAASAWSSQAGTNARVGDFADAASFGELVINAAAARDR